MLTSVNDSVRVYSAPARQRRDRQFFMGVAAAAVITTFVGFAPTYFLRPVYYSTPLPFVVHLHGALFSAWIVLLAVQTTLVSLDRTDLHRQLGIAGGVLAVLMTVVAPVVSIYAARHGDITMNFLVVPMTTVIVFPALVGAALITRRNVETHKRLMLLATTELLQASVGRLPLVRNWGALGDYVATDVFWFALVVYDITTRRRLHPATLCGGIFLIASQPLRIALGNTHIWSAFAQWLVA